MFAILFNPEEPKRKKSVIDDVRVPAGQLVAGLLAAATSLLAARFEGDRCMQRSETSESFFFSVLLVSGACQWDWRR